MTTPLTGSSTHGARRVQPVATGGPPGVDNWEGRAFGALVLVAFVLYGIGSAIADQPLGFALVLLNSLAVIAIGGIGFRLLRRHHPRVGAGYLTARVAEALMLAGGIALAVLADASGADEAAYQLAMLALGVGSVPFCLVLGRGRWLPERLALWGVVGYALLATGAGLELVTGRAIAIVFAVPGGLFELVLGLSLIRRGFAHPAR